MKSEDKRISLSPKQEEFCLRYTGSIGSSQGNATKSYLDTYGCKENTARTQASIALTNPNINTRINTLFKERFNDEEVDNEIAKLIFQDQDRTNKIQAIKEYNKIRGRIHQKVSVGYDASTKAFIDHIRNNPMS